MFLFLKTQNIFVDNYFFADYKSNAKVITVVRNISMADYFSQNFEYQF